MADIQRDCDEKLGNERRALSTKYRLLNLLHPAIARLPDELLLEIFDVANHDRWGWDLHGDREPSFLDPFLAIHLSHVCHHWRDLVFHTPTLWNEVDVTWPDWRADFLPYSKDVPLDLYCNSRPYSRRILDYLTSPQFAQPIGTIRVTLGFSNGAGFLTKIPASSLSRLQAFTLNEHDEDIIHRCIPSFIYNLPDSIRSLKIYGNVWIQRPLSLFIPALHILELHLGDDQYLPMDECIQALSRMHHLRELILWDVFATGDPSVTSQMVLSHLRGLGVSGGIGPCTVFLEHVDSSSLTSIDLDVDLEYTAERIERFTDIIMKIIKCSKIPSKAVGIYDGQSDYSAELRASSTPDLLNIFLAIRVRVHYDDELPGGSSGSPLNPLMFPLVSLDLSGLQYLHVAIETLHPTFWWNSNETTFTTMCIDHFTPFTHPNTWQELENGSGLFSRLHKLIIVERERQMILGTYDPVLTMFQNVYPLSSPLEVSVHWFANPLSIYIIEAMVRGLIISYKRFVEEHANGSSESHLWYHYIPDRVLQSHSAEVKCLVTEEFDPDILDYVHPGSNLTIMFWLEEISQT